MNQNYLQKRSNQVEALHFFLNVTVFNPGIYLISNQTHVK